MNRLLAFSLFFFSWCLSVKAQSAKDFFYADDYRHTINYTDHKIEFYTLPSAQAPGFTETGKKYYWYSNNHINVTQGGFSGKLLHGLYSDFYLSKNLKEQGFFKKGLKDGNWKLWIEDGILINEAEYQKGELNGKFKKYDAKGILIEEGKYRKGKLNGKLKIFASSDSVQIKIYKNGVLQPAKNKKFSRIISYFFKKKNNKVKPK